MTFEEMNPGAKLTDGHAERRALGLKDTEATPAELRTSGSPRPDSTVPLQGSNSEAAARANYAAKGQPDWFTKLKEKK